jgi:hypothetical protein
MGTKDIEYRMSQTDILPFDSSLNEVIHRVRVKAEVRRRVERGGGGGGGVRTANVVTYVALIQLHLSLTLCS